MTLDAIIQALMQQIWDEPEPLNRADLEAALDLLQGVKERNDQPGDFTLAEDFAA